MSQSNSWEFRSIPIDFEVFKALTAELSSPADTYNDVLRRVLGLAKAVRETADADAGAWTVDGATFPQGTEFRAKYKGQFHTGRVEAGALVVAGKRFTSPSPAAMAITRGNVNGWRFWECRLPGESSWRSVDSFRSK